MDFIALSRDYIRYYHFTHLDLIWISLSNPFLSCFPPGFAAQLANSVTSKSPSLVTAGSEDPIAPRWEICTI